MNEFRPKGPKNLHSRKNQRNILGGISGTLSKLGTWGTLAMIAIWATILTTTFSSDCFAGRGASGVAKVYMVEQKTGRVKKTRLITKESLLKGLEERNKIVSKKHGFEVIPPKILDLPRLEKGVLGVSIKFGEPDFKSINAAGPDPFVGQP